jgi:hypothetical protein
VTILNKLRYCKIIAYKKPLAAKNVSINYVLKVF